MICAIMSCVKLSLNFDCCVDRISVKLNFTIWVALDLNAILYY